MKLTFSEKGWEHYVYWQQNDKTKLKRINNLLKAISREAFSGIGQPEPLKDNLHGFWSRRIDEEHRLVYIVLSLEHIEISSCRFHY